MDRYAMDLEIYKPVSLLPKVIWNDGYSYSMAKLNGVSAFVFPHEVENKIKWAFKIYSSGREIGGNMDLESRKDAKQACSGYFAAKNNRVETPLCSSCFRFHPKNEKCFLVPFKGKEDDTFYPA